MKAQIRRAEIKDAKAISTVVQQAIIRVNSADYTSRQMRAWSAHNTKKRFKENIKIAEIFCYI